MVEALLSTLHDRQTFLLRHVYASTMDGLQLSRTSAAFVTFLLSALCHELVMAVVTKKIRPYLFLMQVSCTSLTDPFLATGLVTRPGRRR
jgi:uncharacterized membrane protein YvlD (DUF360 family)